MALASRDDEERAERRKVESGKRTRPFLELKSRERELKMMGVDFFSSFHFRSPDDDDDDDDDERHRKESPRARKFSVFFPVLLTPAMVLAAAWEAVANLLRRLSTALAVRERMDRGREEGERWQKRRERAIDEGRKHRRR